MSWRDSTIDRGDSIRILMQVMNATGVPIGIVVESGTYVLQGTITDGDIRRWILSGGSLDDACENAMNPTPYVRIRGDKCPKDVPLGVHLIPEVTRSHELVGLYDLRPTGARPNPVVIMAGGLGTRLRPLTEDTPKPMIEVGGKPIIQRLVEQFVEQGFRDIHISVNYKAEVIKDFFTKNPCGARISFLEESSARGTAGALALLPAQITPVVVVNGDVITDVDFRKLLDFHTERSAVVTMAVREYKMKCDYGVVATDGSAVCEIVEKPHVGVRVNAGIYVLGKLALAKVPSMPTVKDYLDENSRAWAMQTAMAQVLHEPRYDMPDLIGECLRSKLVVEAFPLVERWLDVGTPAELERARKEFAQ